MTVHAGIENVQPPPAAAGPGNLRPLKHGAGSERTLAPIRAEHIERLRAAHPDVTDAEVFIQASRLARVQLYSDWLDKQGVFRTGRNARKGESWSVLRDLRGDEAKAERWFEHRREEQRLRDLDPQLAHQAYLAELEAGAETPSPPDAVVVEDAEPRAEPTPGQMNLTDERDA